MGGMLRAIERGYIQREIQEASYRCQRRIESGEDVIVGVNRYEARDYTPIDLMVVNEEVGADQCRRLAELRAGRDTASWQLALARLRTAAHGKENLMPPILDAVEALATVGEISDCLRDVFGSYQESVTL